MNLNNFQKVEVRFIEYLVWMGQGFLSDAQRQHKGQWTQPGTQVVPYEHEGKSLYAEGDRSPLVDFRSLEIFKTCLNAFMCNLL